MKPNPFQPEARPHPATARFRAWFRFALAFGGCALGGLAFGSSAATVPIEVAAHRVTAALAEGVALSLLDAPTDDRGLVLVATRLDEDAIQAIQGSPSAANDLVEEVAARSPLSRATKHYIIGALIGFSQICADYPAASGISPNPHVLKLIVAFRRGVKSGAQGRHVTEP